MSDARLSARVDDLPAPELAFDGLAGPLADALLRAADSVRGRVGVPAFAIVELVPGGTSGELLRAAVADVAFRDRARRLAEIPDDVLELAHQEAPGSASLDVLAAATPELQRRLRAAGQALAHVVRTPVTFEFAVELARELEARDWPGASPCFLAVVWAEAPDAAHVDEEPAGSSTMTTMSTRSPGRA